MSILHVENLTRGYDSPEGVTYALNGVSFSVEAGEFVAIVGSSGSGKSTLLHLIGGVDTPTDGHIWVDGKDVAALSADELAAYRRQRVGMIYQFYNLFPMLNVRDNLLLPLKLDGRDADDKQLARLLREVGLAEKEFYYPNQLSGGQQQRVAVARALLQHPTILLADEPTGNLDSKNGAEIMQLLCRCKQEHGQTILLVTHDDKVAAMADRIIEIGDGRIVSDRKKERGETQC